MSKLLTLLIAALVVLLLVKKARRSADRDEAPRRRPRTEPRIERMVVCSHCGVHVPEGEAVSARGQMFCCEEHRRLGG